MTLNLVRVYADETGETRLAQVDLPDPDRADDGMGSPLRRVLSDIPTTTMNINQNLERRPKVDLHPAPRRQLVILLRGAFEVTTTAGDRYLFQPGDCLIADDVDSVGHIQEDVGQEPSVTITVGIPSDWKIPGT